MQVVELFCKIYFFKNKIIFVGKLLFHFKEYSCHIFYRLKVE